MTCERDCIEEQGKKFLDGIGMGFLIGLLFAALLSVLIAVWG